jgi:hypothetical protein
MPASVPLIAATLSAVPSCLETDMSVIILLHSKFLSYITLSRLQSGLKQAKFSFMILPPQPLFTLFRLTTQHSGQCT